MQDTRSRKWQLTINNPIEKGFTHDKIKEILSEFSSLVYWCMSDEVGESGTFILIRLLVFLLLRIGLRRLT